jgi:hypothetical protein
MKEVWDLPVAALIEPSGSEWLLRTLNEVSEAKRVNMMMLL